MKKVLLSAILLISAFVAPVYAQTKYTDAEGDELIARLGQADEEILELKQALRDCTKKYEDLSMKFNDIPLTTIYFYEGSSIVSQLNKNILYALAQEMKTTKINYVLTGWADGYTGSNKVNEKLKNERVKSVKSILVKYGVDESRLVVAMGDGSLAKLGEKGASLDRAVTIVVER